MIENQELITIDENELLSRVNNFMSEGRRLAQIHCTRLDNGFEMNYSFDKDYSLTTLRMVIDKDSVIGSISGIFWSAFLYENEIADLYGVKIINMAVDYKGSLYQSSKNAPFADSSVVKEKIQQS